MINKGITSIISLLLIGLMIWTVAAIPNIEITTSMQVVGNGTYESEIALKGADSNTGLEYYGQAYTPSLGLYGGSEINISAEYLLLQSNHSELQIAEESEITNMRTKRCFKNYELGTLQVFNTFGDYRILSEFGGDTNMSMMMVEAEVTGKTLMEITMRDLNKSHFYIVRDRGEYKGDYTIELSSLIERVEEPRADVEDWLECP